ncbi:MAG: PD-(D/E)XK nuclease family protein [Candidatus Roizmanbacteria bacterium]|nr:PD-(D/E)XK nuclease family protein [Candidatus Roizmanbacteria bacterium]
MAKQDQTKVISGKDLGQLALDDFCPRCFWLERHNGKSPQIFPGIFSTLDSLTKKSVRRSYAERSRQPDWLPFADIKRVVDFKQIKIPVEHGDWILSGTPDDVFQLTDGTFFIADYKTAKYSANQDRLIPMYRVQLNAYAYALPEQGISPISRLALVYCEPSENLDTDTDFKLSFTINQHEIPLDTSEIPKLLLKAREILDSAKPPPANPSCKNICAWVGKVHQNGHLN